jgi:hypothetical protein
MDVGILLKSFASMRQGKYGSCILGSATVKLLRPNVCGAFQAANKGSFEKNMTLWRGALAMAMATTLWREEFHVRVVRVRVVQGAIQEAGVVAGEEVGAAAAAAVAAREANEPRMLVSRSAKQ